MSRGPDGGAEPRAVAIRSGDLVLRGDAWGDPGAPPVVLLHGGGQTRHSWSGCGRRLAAEGWHSLSLDLRGHGDSDWCERGAYAPEDFVSDLRAVAESLPRLPVVVGASLGGLTALLYAVDARGPGAAGIVLVDVTPRIEAAGAARIMDFMLARPEGFESLEEAADAVAAYRRHRSRPRDLGGLRKNLRRGSDGRWRWHWDPRFVDGPRSRTQGGTAGRALSETGFANGDRLLGAARRLDMPTLLVRGRESDVVSPEGVREFREAVPHARFVDVSGAGHMVAGDRNDVFNEAVVGFLRTFLA